MTNATLRSARVLALLLLAACVSAPNEPTPGASERWRYAGTQRLPSVLQLEGGLELTRIRNDRFEGTLDVQRTDLVGNVQRAAGLVVGRHNTLSMEFEATLDGAVVRHIGRASGDSITGTWFDDSGQTAAFTSGTFVLVRQR